LLAVDDESRIGALRFRDEHGDYQGCADDGNTRTPPLLELRHLLAATHAVEMSTETVQDLAYLRGRATSLGGLRPKCSLRDDDGGLALAKFSSVTGFHDCVLRCGPWTVTQPYCEITDSAPCPSFPRRSCSYSNATQIPKAKLHDKSTIRI